jgi:hypothetical protein
MNAYTKRILTNLVNEIEADDGFFFEESDVDLFAEEERQSEIDEAWWEHCDAANHWNSQWLSGSTDECYDGSQCTGCNPHCGYESDYTDEAAVSRDGEVSAMYDRKALAEHVNAQFMDMMDSSILDEYHPMAFRDNELPQERNVRPIAHFGDKVLTLVPCGQAAVYRLNGIGAIVDPSSLYDLILEEHYGY